MPGYILDTTTLTHVRHGHPAVAAALRAHAGQALGVTTVNVEEALGGYYNLLRKARSPEAEEYASTLLAESVTALSRFIVHPVTVAARRRFDALLKLRLNVGRADLKIAAVALELGATVVTDNARDFGRMPGLAWEDWTA